jgi:hypothetical protein
MELTMLYQNLNNEIVIALIIWFIVMFLFAIMLIAGLGSILSEHRTKIASRIKTTLKSNSVVAKFTKFLPDRNT